MFVLLGTIYAIMGAMGSLSISECSAKTNCRSSVTLDSVSLKPLQVLRKGWFYQVKTLN